MVRRDAERPDGLAMTTSGIAFIARPIVHGIFARQLTVICNAFNRYSQCSLYVADNQCYMSIAQFLFFRLLIQLRGDAPIGPYTGVERGKIGRIG